FIFFFQAEDGIRDFHVTGVQTCALPIWERLLGFNPHVTVRRHGANLAEYRPLIERLTNQPGVVSAAPLVEGPVLLERLAENGSKIGRASCRERGQREVDAVSATNEIDVM